MEAKCNMKLPKSNAVSHPVTADLMTHNKSLQKLEVKEANHASCAVYILSKIDAAFWMK
jgi:hypothetical protein